jgi:hypothetical protein
MAMMSSDYISSQRLEGLLTVINIVNTSRPSTLARCIQPCKLHDHCMSHQMLGPCCFCPLAYPSGPDFMEAAIHMVLKGLFAGEYVASCAKGRCNYFSKSSTLLRASLADPIHPSIYGAPLHQEWCEN